jgi:adenylosuccinate lyase
VAEGIIANLRFFPENIKRNLELMGGLNMGEAVMIELAKRGVGRQDAHEIVRTSAMEARESGRHMKEVLMSKSEVTEFISAEEIEGVMDREGYIGTAVEQVEAVVGRLRGEH